MMKRKGIFLFLFTAVMFIGLNFCEPFNTDYNTTDPNSPVISTATIAVSNQTNLGLNLSWTKASDDVTAQSALQYLVYYSTSNNLGNVTEFND